MSCFIGFDGFIDEIIRPVASRENGHPYVPFITIQAFSERLASSSGKSCNIELVVQEKKIGGNGPILALSLMNLGHPVRIAGTFGKDKCEEIFKPLADKALELFTFGDPGHSDALEFSDGKIILGKLGSLQHLSSQDVIRAIGEKKLLTILDECSLFVSANWTMLPMMNDLWEYLIDNILPKLSLKKRLMFVDFADPAKRSDEALKKAVQLLRGFNQIFEVTLGLNYAEAVRFCNLFNLKKTSSIETMAASLFEAIKVTRVVVHTPKSGAAAEKGGTESSNAFFIENPKIATGAGDNFNAGFCHALLHQEPLKKALIKGHGTAGFYVQNGKSPTIEELAIFCCAWDNCKV